VSALLLPCLPVQVTSKLRQRAAAVQGSMQRWSKLVAVDEDRSTMRPVGGCWDDVSQWLAVELPGHMQVSWKHLQLL
jgi:hypothetical protein